MAALIIPDRRQLTLDRETRENENRSTNSGLDANQQLSHKFLVNKAVQAEKILPCPLDDRPDGRTGWIPDRPAGITGYGTLPRNPLPHLMQPNNRYE